MTRSFAFLSSDAALLSVAIAPFEAALMVPEGAPQGWGMAYYQNSQPLLRKQPRADSGPLSLVATAADLRASLLLGQVREPSDAPNLNENTAPFRFRRWTFSLIGSPNEIDKVGDELRGSIPEFILRNINGRTEGELIFHLLLAFLHDGGKLDDPRIPSATVARALASTLSYLDRLLGSGWPYCCFATNGEILVAKHRGAPLSLARNTSYQNVGVGPDDKPISYPHLRAAALVGGGEPGGGAESRLGWESVDEAAVLIANRNLDIELVPA